MHSLELVLFLDWSECLVQNLGLKNVNITGSSDFRRIGWPKPRCYYKLLRYRYGNRYWHVGGLVGVNSSGTITSSYAIGTVTGTKLCRRTSRCTTSSGTITSSYAIDTVSGSGNFIGGLVGQNNSNGTITNSYATCAVSGIDDFIGGLVGQNSSGTITNSYVTDSR